jgi:N-acyl homoserine lactone hydrolase
MQSNRCKLPYWCYLIVVAGCLTACAVPATRHTTDTSHQGTPVSIEKMLTDLKQPGIIEFNKIAVAHWNGPRKIFLDLGSNIAKQNKLENVTEQATLFFYPILHPTEGLLLIDTGIAENVKQDSGFLVRKLFLDRMTLYPGKTTSGLLRQFDSEISAVFLTHLHVDHIVGLPDIKKSTPIYIGANETSNRHWSHWFYGDTFNNLLRDFGNLQEWSFVTFEESAEDTAQAIDIFDDGSIWAINVPGHTPGSIAYLVNSTTGPQLITGDAIHTRIGWELRVPQSGLASISLREQEQESSNFLHELVGQNPQIKVHLGHQEIGG